MVEGIDEVLALLGRGGPPVLSSTIFAEKSVSKCGRILLTVGRQRSPRYLRGPVSSLGML
jgi:hypothetical protein